MVDGQLLAKAGFMAKRSLVIERLLPKRHGVCLTQQGALRERSEPGGLLAFLEAQFETASTLGDRNHFHLLQTELGVWGRSPPGSLIKFCERSELLFVHFLHVFNYERIINIFYILLNTFNGRKLNISV